MELSELIAARDKLRNQFAEKWNGDKIFFTKEILKLITQATILSKTDTSRAIIDFIVETDSMFNATQPNAALNIAFFKQEKIKASGLHATGQDEKTNLTTT